MMPSRTRNQVNSPLPKKKRVDANGNDRRRLWLKDGKTTMPLTSGLTQAGCEVLIDAIVSAATRLGAKIDKTRFLITR